MAGKYAPLENYLRNLPDSRTAVSLSFQQIEQILNTPLPASAYEDQRWWEHETEGNHLTRRAWTTAGWQIARLDVNRQRVRLIRGK